MSGKEERAAAEKVARSDVWELAALHLDEGTYRGPVGFDDGRLAAIAVEAMREASVGVYYQIVFGDGKRMVCHREWLSPRLERPRLP